MSSEEPDPGGEGAYCIHCGEPIPDGTDTCRECGREQTIDDPVPAGERGFTSWAIGFRPGSTLRNVFVGIAYFLFYVVGVPLLLYAYWKRGEKYRKRTYGVIGVLIVGVFALGAVGALVGPVEEPNAGTQASQVADAATPEPTPEPDPEPEFAARISYSGSWQGALSVTGGGGSQSESISGSGTETIEITGDVDIISVNAQKQDDSSAELRVEILHDGEVVAQANTASQYGVAQTSQSF